MRRPPILFGATVITALSSLFSVVEPPLNYRPGPGRRSILNMRPGHPGKPRSYYQRINVPKHLRVQT